MALDVIKNDHIEIRAVLCRGSTVARIGISRLKTKTNTNLLSPISSLVFHVCFHMSALRSEEFVHWSFSALRNTLLHFPGSFAGCRISFEDIGTSQLEATDNVPWSKSTCYTNEQCTTVFDERATVSKDKVCRIR